MKFPESKILIFCKAPVLGTVKTRMQPYLTKQESVDLHKTLVLETVEKAVESQLSAVEVWCAPDCYHEFFQTLLKKYPITLHRQTQGTLGDKMADAIERSLQSSESAILIGTDCPSMTSFDFEEAMTLLRDQVELAISPAEDGGYTMIGMSKFIPEVFQNIDWGTETVFAQTLESISKLKTRLEILDTQWDIDHPADLERYRKLPSVKG